jgi:hypothetical protein
MPGPPSIYVATPNIKLEKLQTTYLRSNRESHDKKTYFNLLNKFRNDKKLVNLTPDEFAGHLTTIEREYDIKASGKAALRPGAGITYLPPPPGTMSHRDFIDFLNKPFEDSESLSEDSVPPTIASVNASLDDTLNKIVALANSGLTQEEANSLHSSVESQSQSQSQPRTQASLPSFPSSVASESVYEDTMDISTPDGSALGIIRANGPYYFTPSPSQDSVHSPDSDPPPLEQLEMEMIGKITNGICFTVEKLFSAARIAIPPTVSALIAAIKTSFLTVNTLIKWKYTVAVLFLILRRYPVLQPYMDMFALTVFKFIGKHTGITDMINMVGAAANTALQAALDRAIAPMLVIIQQVTRDIANLPGDIKAAVATMVSEFKDELKAIVIGGLQAGAERAVIDAALNAAHASFWTRFTQAAAPAAAHAAATTAIGVLMNGAQVALNALPALTNGLGGGKRKTKTSKKRKTKTNKKRKTKTRRR